MKCKSHTPLTPLLSFSPLSLTHPLHVNPVLFTTLSIFMDGGSIFWDVESMFFLFFLSIKNSTSSYLW